MNKTALKPFLTCILKYKQENGNGKSSQLN